MSLDQTLGAFNEIGPASYPPGSDAAFVVVTPDIDRRAVERGEYAQKHLASSGLPNGHGFSQTNVDQKTMYYATQVGGVKLIVIDSVNQFGGWQGSLDVAQFEWLENEISQSKIPCVLASHHPLSTIFNDYAPYGRRVCMAEIESMLIKYPQVIAWLAGHEHRHHVEWVGPKIEEVGFWHIETSSHIDWPQQSRTVEIVETDAKEIFIGLTVIDHAGGISYGAAVSPVELAALSRVLSANVWQKRDSLGAIHSQDWAIGEVHERNSVLRILKR